MFFTVSLSKLYKVIFTGEFFSCLDEFLRDLWNRFVNTLWSIFLILHVVCGEMCLLIRGASLYMSVCASSTSRLLIMFLNLSISLPTFCLFHLSITMSKYESDLLQQLWICQLLLITCKFYP